MNKIKAYFMSIFVCLIFGCIMTSLTACSAMDRIVSVGAKANDQALDAAEFTICKAATVGSIRRRYGSKEQAATWRGLCDSIEKDNFSPEVTGGDTP